MSEKPSAMERLLPKISIRAHDECWPWKAAIGAAGYGTFWLEGQNINASRAAYLLLNGRIPDGAVVCHSCDNSICCNPNHLWLGTQGDNVRDCNNKGRGKGQFAKGHAPAGRAMTKQQILEAKALYFYGGVTQTEIGRRMGFHSSVISRAVRRSA